MDRFEQLETQFTKLLSYTGVRITDKPLRKTLFQKIYSTIGDLCGLLFNFTMVIFVYYHRHDLMKLLTQMENSLVTCIILAELFIFLMERKVLSAVWEWCKSRHELADLHLRRIGYPFFKKAVQDSESRVRLLQRAFLFCFVMCAFGMVGLKFFLENDPFPFPFPIHFFGIPATNFWSFAMNILLQWLGTLSNVINTLSFHMWLTVAFRHIFASLEAALFAIENMEEVVEDTSFEEWLRVVHSFLMDATFYFRIVGQIASKVIYVEQKTMFTVLFVGWLTVKIEPSNLPNTVAFTSFVFIIFVICSINEEFKQKYEDIGFALYQLPWYDLEPKERLLLIPLMVAAQNHPILRAGGLDEMTYENYLNFIKGAYSTAILMEELIFAS